MTMALFALGQGGHHLHSSSSSPVGGLVRGVMASVRGFVGAALAYVVSRSTLTVAIVAFVLGFALFQKKLLPPALAAIAAKTYFYPTLPFTYARLCLLPPRAGLWTAVDDTVLVGAAPVPSVLGFGSRAFQRRLAVLGVRGVINLCAEYAGPGNWDEYDVQHLWLPTVDHVEPSRDDIETAVRFIDDLKKSGHKCYVHCKAGHGRSAAVAFSWLCYINYGKVAPYDLYQDFASKRRVRSGLWRQPNVQAFYDSLPLNKPLNKRANLQKGLVSLPSPGDAKGTAGPDEESSSSERVDDARGDDVGDDVGAGDDAIVDEAASTLRTTAKNGTAATGRVLFRHAVAGTTADDGPSPPSTTPSLRRRWFSWLFPASAAGDKKDAL